MSLFPVIVVFGLSFPPIFFNAFVTGYFLLRVGCLCRRVSMILSGIHPVYYRAVLLFVLFNIAPVRLRLRETLTRKLSRTAITLVLVILAFIAIFRACVLHRTSPTRDARFSADVVAIAPMSRA